MARASKNADEGCSTSTLLYDFYSNVNKMAFNIVNELHNVVFPYYSVFLYLFCFTVYTHIELNSTLSKYIAIPGLNCNLHVK